MHIGIFGGTFNPIHTCHLQIAEQVKTECNLDRIIFIPTGDPPHKDSTSLAPAHDRLAMVQLALESKHSFSVSDIEVRSPNVSYTVDTVTQLQQEYRDGTQWSFIIGLDAFLELHTWKQASHLLDLCHFIVCSRPGVDFTKIPSVTCLPPIPDQRLKDLENGNIHRYTIPLSTSMHLTLLALPPCEASSSLIRLHFQQGRPDSHWLPPHIESYIIQHCLYLTNPQ